MEITSVKIRKFFPEGKKLRAIVSVTFDGILAVHEIKVIDNQGQLFIAMPSKRSGGGHFSDIIHPVNQETRNKIEAHILAAYNARAALDDPNDSISWLNPENDEEEPSSNFLPPANVRETFLRDLFISTITDEISGFHTTGESFNITHTIQSKVVQALLEIRSHLDDQSLDDFMCIEEIVQVFERLGIDGGFRHDYG